MEIKISPKALADKLTMAGLEVTSLEERDGDFVFEIEITSNRPDCLSVMGIAREIAAINSRKLIRCSVGPLLRSTSQRANEQTSKLTIDIKDKKDCPLYTAKIINDVKVGPAPEWLKKRLELVGCRSVNNIVDITNYVLFTYGEPLHAFDWDKLSGDMIIVRRAKNNEKIITIDAEEKALNTDILVIADREKPVAIAGVMGGRYTEVTKNTKNILLEAAVFNPILVRRARQKLGIQSESAYRFERGVNPEIVEAASGQAAKLLEEICGGKCILAKTSGLIKAKKKKVTLNIPNINKILGTTLAPSRIKSILNNLEFEVRSKRKDTFEVLVPSHRPDINLEVDLAEEISRIYDYAKIGKTLPEVRPHISVGDKRKLVSLAKNMLVGLGLNEVITYSLIDKNLLKTFSRTADTEAIEILNPLSREQEILRPTLIPSLIRCLAYNLNQNQDYSNIFEVAKAFLGSEGLPKEELVLGIGLCGAKSQLLPQGLVKEEMSLLHLKGILEVFFGRLGIKDYGFESADNSREITIYVHKEKAGLMVSPPRSVLEKFEIKNKAVFVAEVFLEKAFSHADLKKKLVPLPIYPGISRDTSFVLKENISAGEILKAVEQKGAPLLKEAKIVDYYRGRQIPDGFKGLTISCLYRSEARTLTEAEINLIHSAICGLLTGRFGAEIRT